MIRNGVILAASLLLLAGSSSAQFISGQFDSTHVIPQVTRFDFVGGGAKAEGMGNAFIGIANDVMGGTWNPAGLNIHETPTISYGHQLFLPKGSVSSSATTVIVPNPIVDDVIFSSPATEYSQSGTLNNLNDIYGVFPVRIRGHKFVGGFGYYRAWDEYQHDVQPLTFEFTQIPNPNNLSDQRRLTAYTTFDEELSGGVDVVNFSFGTRMYETFSFGASVNVYTGQTERVLTVHSTVDSLGIVTGGGGGGVVVQDATLEEFVRVTDTNKFSGINFTLGGKYESEKLDVGLVIRTPFTMDVTKNTVKDSLGRTLGEGGVVPYDSLTVFADDSLTKYDMPLMVGLGFGFRATEKLLVALDLEYRGFSGSAIRKRSNRILNPGGSDIEEYIEIDPDWRNVFAFRGGFEYMMKTSFGEVPIRGGGGYTPLPEGDVQGNPSELHLSLGSGIHFSQIDLDFAYVFSSIDRDAVDNLTGVIATTQTNRDHRLVFQFTGYF